MRFENDIICVDDVRIAVQDSLPENRANATMRLAKAVKNPNLSEKDRAYANKVLAVISEDVSDLVRRALAITLRNSPFIPKEVLGRLIQDIDSIAVPLIQHSPVLTDDDLGLILKSGIAGKIRAVAARADLSNHVIQSLISSGDVNAVQELAANDRITLSAEAAESMIAAYREDDLIKAALLNRASMPMSVVEKLVAVSSDDIADRLYADTNLQRSQTKQIGAETYQRTLVSLPNEHFSEKALKDLVANMKERERLTPTIILRAMGLGQIGMVHYGLSSLAGLSVRKVVLMLHDTGPFALRGLCAKAGLDEAQSLFMSHAIKIYSDLESIGETLSANDFQNRMIERVLTMPKGLSDRDADYFMGILDGLSEEMT
jgi:uncharacterized protein (DUF2336 family)